MKSKLLLLGALGVTAGLMSACHHDNGPGPTPQPTTQSLDTAQVLAIAQQTSETSYPIPVNDGYLTLNDTSETSEPISVNAT